MAAYQYVYVMDRLSKTYPGGKQVLKDIRLSFLPGVKIGVVGLNGAGKSTLLRIMAGVDKEFTGEAWAAEPRAATSAPTVIDACAVSASSNQHSIVPRTSANPAL